MDIDPVLNINITFNINFFFFINISNMFFFCIITQSFRILKYMKFIDSRLVVVLVYKTWVSTIPIIYTYFLSNIKNQTY